MKHSDFKIGIEFLTATGRWQCTDVGSRTISAIRLDLDHDPAWYNGPPYAVAEHVFDEDGIGECDPAPLARAFDDSGKGRLVTVDRFFSTLPVTREPPQPSPESADQTLSRYGGHLYYLAQLVVC